MSLREPAELRLRRGDEAPRSAVRPPDTWYVRRGKRFVDVVLACGLLIVAAPLLGAVSLAIVATMGRPVLFRQSRVGLGGEPFEMLKFRTMRPDRRRGRDRRSGARGDRRVDHKSDADPRHTSVGRALRAAGIDELPQLLNILRGEMSIVGPRPEMVAVAQREGLLDHPRHTVRPGLTGLWQVSGDRPGYVHENVHYDSAYVAQLSARTDLWILRRTVGVVLRRSGR